MTCSTNILHIWKLFLNLCFIFIFYNLYTNSYAPAHSCCYPHLNSAWSLYNVSNLQLSLHKIHRLVISLLQTMSVKFRGAYFPIVTSTSLNLINSCNVLQRLHIISLHPHFLRFPCAKIYSDAFPSDVRDCRRFKASSDARENKCILAFVCSFTSKRVH